MSEIFILLVLLSDMSLCLLVHPGSRRTQTRSQPLGSEVADPGELPRGARGLFLHCPAEPRPSQAAGSRPRRRGRASGRLLEPQCRRTERRRRSRRAQEGTAAPPPGPARPAGPLLSFTCRDSGGARTRGPPPGVPRHGRSPSASGGLALLCCPGGPRDAPAGEGTASSPRVCVCVRAASCRRPRHGHCPCCRGERGRRPRGPHLALSRTLREERRGRRGEPPGPARCAAAAAAGGRSPAGRGGGGGQPRRRPPPAVTAPHPARWCRPQHGDTVEERLRRGDRPLPPPRHGHGAPRVSERPRRRCCRRCPAQGSAAADEEEDGGGGRGGGGHSSSGGGTERPRAGSQHRPEQLMVAPQTRQQRPRRGRQLSRIPAGGSPLSTPTHRATRPSPPTLPLPSPRRDPRLGSPPPGPDCHYPRAPRGRRRRQRAPGSARRRRDHGREAEQPHRRQWPHPGVLGRGSAFLEQ